MRRFFRRLFDCDDDIKSPRIFWFIALGFFWMLWIVGVANRARGEAEAELATHTNAIAHWWHNNEPADAYSTIIARGVFGLILVFIAGHYSAILQRIVIERVAHRRRELQEDQHRREIESKVLLMERESDQHATLSKLAQSKHEIIMRLGNVDQYIRVLDIETDPSKRTIALQAAHSEMTMLSSKLASGQITAEAIDAPEIREHAAETSSDLVRLGLPEDRLTRDIKRLFKLNGQQSG